MSPFLTFVFLTGARPADGKTRKRTPVNKARGPRTPRAPRVKTYPETREKKTISGPKQVGGVTGAVEESAARLVIWKKQSNNEF